MCVCVCVSFLYKNVGGINKKTWLQDMEVGCGKKEEREAFMMIGL